MKNIFVFKFIVLLVKPFKDSVVVSETFSYKILEYLFRFIRFSDEMAECLQSQTEDQIIKIWNLV